jgi:uncharacterized protein (TIGR00251 family)
MRINVRVKPNARKNEVVQLDDNQFLVRVTAPPVEGRANEKMIELLAEYFHKPKRCIAVVRGEASKHKVVEVE